MPPPEEDGSFLCPRLLGFLEMPVFFPQHRHLVFEEHWIHPKLRVHKGHVPKPGCKLVDACLALSEVKVPIGRRSTLQELQEAEEDRMGERDRET